MVNRFDHIHVWELPAGQGMQLHFWDVVPPPFLMRECDCKEDLTDHGFAHTLVNHSKNAISGKDLTSVSYAIYWSLWKLLTMKLEQK